MLHNLPEQAQEYRWFFDPEGKEGRTERLAGEIARRPELRIAGGFVPLKRLSEELEMDTQAEKLVLERFLKERPEFSVVEVDGVPILKRAR